MVHDDCPIFSFHPTAIWSAKLMSPVEEPLPCYDVRCATRGRGISALRACPIPATFSRLSWWRE
eukprot:scaffold69906_cov33-Tisochrysis_lutea.AAC.4